MRWSVFPTKHNEFEQMIQALFERDLRITCLLLCYSLKSNEKSANLTNKQIIIWPNNQLISLNPLVMFRKLIDIYTFTLLLLMQESSHMSTH